MKFNQFELAIGLFAEAIIKQNYELKLIPILGTYGDLSNAD